MGYHWHDLVGNLGVAAIVAAYLALQMGWLEGRSLRYSAANALGALLVLASLVVEFNLSAFVMEAFWLAISLLGVVRGLRGRAEGQS